MSFLGRLRRDSPKPDPVPENRTLLGHYVKDDWVENGAVFVFWVAYPPIDTLTEAIYIESVVGHDVTMRRFLVENPIHDLDLTWPQIIDLSTKLGITIDDFVRYAKGDDDMLRTRLYMGIGEHMGWDTIDKFPVNINFKRLAECYPIPEG